MIYAVRDHDGLIKIGYSWDPRERWMALCRQYGKLEKIGVVEGTVGQERRLHRMLTPWAVSGLSEWYHPTRVVLTAVSMFGPWTERQMCRFKPTTAPGWTRPGRALTSAPHSKPRAAGETPAFPIRASLVAA